MHAKILILDGIHCPCHDMPLFRLALRCWDHPESPKIGEDWPSTIDTCALAGLQQQQYLGDAMITPSCNLGTRTAFNRALSTNICTALYKHLSFHDLSIMALIPTCWTQQMVIMQESQGLSKSGLEHL